MSGYLLLVAWLLCGLGTLIGLSVGRGLLRAVGGGWIPAGGACGGNSQWLTLVAIPNHLARPPCRAGIDRAGGSHVTCMRTGNDLCGEIRFHPPRRPPLDVTTCQYR